MDRNSQRNWQIYSRAEREINVSLTNHCGRPRSHAPAWECRLRLACLNLDPNHTPSALRPSGGGELVESSSATLSKHRWTQILYPRASVL